MSKLDYYIIDPHLLKEKLKFGMLILVEYYTYTFLEFNRTNFINVPDVTIKLPHIEQKLQ